MPVHNMHSTIPGTQAVSRAIHVLKLFLGAESELSMAQVTERTGLNRTTAFRLVRVLEAEGLLEQIDDSAVYRIGPEIAALSRRATGQRASLQEVAQSELDQLAERLQETASLEILQDGRALVVAEGMGGRMLSAMPCVGQSWALHATATGKVLMAGLPHAARKPLLATSLERFTPHTTVMKTAVSSEVDTAARRGYAFNFEELELGYLAVAVPISDGDGGTLAALGVGGPKGRVTRKRLRDWVPTLQQSAQRIEEAWVRA